MAVTHDREHWLLDKRREIEERYDHVFASDYDLRFPDIGATHHDFVDMVVSNLDEDSWILDVGCGTGKHWPAIFSSGARVIGVDISAQMLQRAKEKFPYVTTHRQAVQDLSLSERFDAVLFIDVFDLIGPEDWAPTLVNLRSVVRPEGLLYFTVADRPPDTELEQSLAMARLRGIPAVSGELAHGLSYQHFPTDEQIHEWVDETALVVIKAGRGDGCRHFVVAAEGSVDPASGL